MSQSGVARAMLAAGVALGLALAGSVVLAQEPATGAIVVTDGLSTPESALHDRAADVYLVSNINGNPSAKDGNGFISRVTPDGKMEALKWIDGTAPGVTLHAPKGLAIRGDTLLVADIDTIRLFDRGSGKPAGEWPVPGATFMNDITVGPDGTVYATDSGLDLSSGKPEPTGTQAVYRFDAAGKPTRIAGGKELQGPNGVLAGADGLIVVEFLGNRALRIDADGKVSTRFTLPQGGLDGVERLADGSLLISSWEANAVFQVDARGTARPLVENVPSPADIGVDAKRNRVLIPLFQDNALRIVPLPGSP